MTITTPPILSASPLARFGNNFQHNDIRNARLLLRPADFFARRDGCTFWHNEAITGAQDHWEHGAVLPLSVDGDANVFLDVIKQRCRCSPYGRTDKMMAGAIRRMIADVGRMGCYVG